MDLSYGNGGGDVYPKKEKRERQAADSRAKEGCEMLPHRASLSHMSALLLANHMLQQLR